MAPAVRISFKFSILASYRPYEGKLPPVHADVNEEETRLMGRLIPVVLTALVAGAAGFVLAVKTTPPVEIPAPLGFAAVPDAIGAQDVSGPYEVQEGWPKDLSTLPGHEKLDLGRRARASSPRTRTACTCSSAASCRT